VLTAIGSEARGVEFGAAHVAPAAAGAS